MTNNRRYFLDIPAQGIPGHWVPLRYISIGLHVPCHLDYEYNLCRFEIEQLILSLAYGSS